MESNPRTRRSRARSSAVGDQQLKEESLDQDFQLDNDDSSVVDDVFCSSVKYKKRMKLVNDSPSNSDNDTSQIKHSSGKTEREEPNRTTLTPKQKYIRAQPFNVPVQLSKSQLITPEDSFLLHNISQNVVLPKKKIETDMLKDSKVEGANGDVNNTQETPIENDVYAPAHDSSKNAIQNDSDTKFMAKSTAENLSTDKEAEINPKVDQQTLSNTENHQAGKGDYQETEAIKETMTKDQSGQKNPLQRQSNPNIENVTEASDVSNVQKNRTVAVTKDTLGTQNSDKPASLGDLIEVLPHQDIFLPTYSKWFSMHAIHSIEKRALPEFFDSQSSLKTPEIYIEYRNYMITAWRKNPVKYLSATTARQNLAGDVCAIIRVHEFLDHWGLINARPTDTRNTFQGITNTPRLLLFDDGGPSAQKHPEKDTAVQGMAFRREIYAASVAVQYNCDYCKQDCSRLRFHCTTKADMDICPACFADGKYPPSMDAKDFAQLTAVASGDGYYDSAVWTEKETLMLLEALEMHSDNWDLVSEYVGTKSKDSCVLQFLRLPIEDPYLEDAFAKWEPEDRNRPIKFHDLFSPVLPFSDSENPIMAQIAYLASSVSSDIASAAAQAAMNALLNPEYRAKLSERKDSVVSELPKSEVELAYSKEMNHSKEVKNEVDRKRELDKLGSHAIEATAAVALAAAATRAKKLADGENREIDRLFSIAIETKLKSLELKMKHFETLEQQLTLERNRLEKHRHHLYSERLTVALKRKEGSNDLNLKQQKIIEQTQGETKQGMKGSDDLQNMKPKQDIENSSNKIDSGMNLESGRSGTQIHDNHR